MNSLSHSLKQAMISSWMAFALSAMTFSIMVIDSHSVIAETVYTSVGQQGTAKQPIAKPKRGMTKTQVKDAFGVPDTRKSAVGEPPISSWVYNDFTVYFEYNHVIHSVLTHQPIN